MATVNEFSFPSSNGTDSIHVKEWSPDTNSPKGVLQISHGVMEHFGRYDDFAEFMAAKGFIVVGNDHLGHGKSVSSKDGFGYFADSHGWQHVVADLHSLYLSEHEKCPNLPYFLMGHSMGSFLVRTFLINYPEAELAGVLLSGTGQHPGPMIQAGLAAVAHEKKKLGNHGRSKKVYDLCFGIYNRKFKSARTPSDWTTRDEAMVDAHMKDPLGNFIPTLELFDEMLNGIKYIGKKENIAKVNKKLPILLFSGDKDPVGDSGRGVKKVYRAYVSAGVQDVSIKLYPGGRHEMLNEINRSEVYDYISDWIFSKM